MAIPEVPHNDDAYPAIWHMIRVFLHDSDVDALRLDRALSELDSNAPPGQRPLIYHLTPSGEYRNYFTGEILGHEFDLTFTLPALWRSVSDIEDELPYRRTRFTGVPDDLCLDIRAWVDDNHAEAAAYLERLGIDRLPVTEADLAFHHQEQP